MVEFGCHYPSVGHAPKFREIVFAVSQNEHDFGVFLPYWITVGDDWNRDGCLRSLAVDGGRTGKTRIKSVLTSGKLLTFCPKIERNVCGCSHNALCKADTGYQKQNTSEFRQRPRIGGPA